MGQLIGPLVLVLVLLGVLMYERFCEKPAPLGFTV
jgi:hypothetical protein